VGTCHREKGETGGSMEVRYEPNIPYRTMWVLREGGAMIAAPGKQPMPGWRA